MNSKRFIAGFLALLMVVCMLPVDMFGTVSVVYAAAEDVELGEEGDTETYTDADTDAGADTDTGADTDAGADTDTGADTNTDVDTDTDDSNIDEVDLPAMDLVEPEPEETDIINAVVEFSETVQGVESSVKTPTKTVYKLDPREINPDPVDPYYPVRYETGTKLGTNGYFTTGEGVKFQTVTGSKFPTAAGDYTYIDNVPDNTIKDAEGNETTLTGNPENAFFLTGGYMREGKNLIKFTTKTENATIEIYAALHYNASSIADSKLVILYESDNSKELQYDVLNLDDNMTRGEIVKCTATLEMEGTYYVGFANNSGAIAYAEVTETESAVKTPTAAPKAGDVAVGTRVKLSSEDESAEIYYLTKTAEQVNAADFIAPKADDIVREGSLYTTSSEEIEITASMTIFAVAKIGTEYSKVASFKYYTVRKTVYKLDSREINLDNNLVNNEDLTGKTLGTNGYFTMGNGAKFYSSPSSTAYTFKDDVPDNIIKDAEGNETTLTGNEKKFILVHYGAMNNGSNLIKFTTETENAEIEIYAALRYNADTDTNPNQKLVILYETDNSKDLQTDVLKLDPMTPGEIIKCTATLGSEGTYYVGFTGSGGAFAYAAVTETEYAVKTPTAAPKAGDVAVGTRVKLSSEDENAEIYYLTKTAEEVNAADFIAPKADDIVRKGSPYTTSSEGIKITASMTIFAVAKIGAEYSKVASFKYNTVRKTVYKLDPREINSEPVDPDNPVRYDTGTKLGTNGYFTTGQGAKFHSVPSDYTYKDNVPDNTIIDAEGNETILTGNPENAIFITGGAMNEDVNFIKFTTKTENAKIEIYAALKPNASDGKKLVISTIDFPSYDDVLNLPSMNKGEIIKCTATLEWEGTYYVGFTGGGGAIAYVTVTETKEVSAELEPPTADPEDYNFLHEGDEVRLDWDDEEAEVYYTTGATYNAAVDPITAPDDKKHKYERPIIINADNRFIKAYAVKGEEVSDVAEFEYILQVEAPTATPNKIVLEDGDLIELSSKTNDAKIYYSIDDPDIGISDKLYTKGFKIDKTTTIKAYAEKNGFETSEEVEFLYIVPSDETDYFTINAADGEWINDYFTSYNITYGNISYVDQLRDALTDWKEFVDISETPYEDAFMLKDGSMPSAGNEPRNCIKFATSAADTKVVAYFATKATSEAKLTIAKYADGKIGEHFTDIAVEGSNTKITKAEFRLTEPGIYCIGFVGGAGGAGGGIIPYMEVVENPITLTFMDGDEVFTTRAAYKGEEYYLDNDPGLIITDVTGKKVFKGWTIKKENAGLGTWESITPTEDTTLYAVWAQLFTVTLEPGDEAIETEFPGFPQEAEEGQLIMLPNASPKTEGYEFRGWRKKGAEDAEIIMADNNYAYYMPTEDIILVPVFADSNTLLKVWLDYDCTDYWADSLIDSFTVVKDDEGKATITLALLKTPERDGYTFEGWVALDEEGKETEYKVIEDTDSVKIEADTTFKAKWKKIETYNVIFAAIDNSVLYSYYDLLKDTVIVLPDAPEDSVKESETAIWMWKVDTPAGDAETEEYAVGYEYPVISNVVFKGYWKEAPGASYTVTLEPDADTTETTFAGFPATVEEGGEVTLPNATPKTDGHVFRGWKEKDVQNAEIIPAGSKYAPTKDITLVPVFADEGTLLIVTRDYGYQENGEEKTDSDLTVTKNDEGKATVTLTLLGTPERAGYKFKEWVALDAAGAETTTKVNEETASVVIEGNTTFLAMWSKNTVPLEAPTIAPTTGAVIYNDTTIRITNPNDADKSEVRYTTDSSEPTAGATLYTDPIVAGDIAGKKGGEITIKAAVFPKTGNTDNTASSVEAASYTVRPAEGSEIPDKPDVPSDVDVNAKIFVRFVDEDGNSVDPDDEYRYTGAKVEPKIEVYNYGKLLKSGSDYTVKYKNNIKATTNASLTVTGKGNLSGSAEMITFTIKPEDIKDVAYPKNMTVAVNTKVAPVIMHGTKKLGNKDYKLEGSGLTNGKYTATGDYTLTVTGQGNNYDANSSFTINVKVVEKNAAAAGKLKVKVDTRTKLYSGKLTVENSISDLVVKPTDAKADNDAVTPIITVTDKNGKILTEDTDFVIYTASSLIDAGTVKFTVAGMGEYSGTVNKSFKILPSKVTDDKKFEVTFKEKDYEFKASGTTVDGLVVKYLGESADSSDDIELTEGVHYKVAYSNNKKVSTDAKKAKIKITFLGNYKGSKAVTKDFIIKTAKMTMKDGEDGNTVVVVPDKAYGKAGKAYKSTPIVMVDGAAIKASNYTVHYSWKSENAESYKPDDKVQVTIDGDDAYALVKVKIELKENASYAAAADGNTPVAIEGEYKVVKPGEKSIDLSKAKVVFTDKSGNKKPSLEYNGKEFYTPDTDTQVDDPNAVYVKVTYKNEPISSELYDVKWTNATEKGKATVVITGKGTGTTDAKGNNAIGSKNASISIKPMKFTKTTKLPNNKPVVANVFKDVLDMIF